MSMGKMKIHSLHQDQSGQTAIFITLVLIIVMGLISLGIFVTSYVDSREALDSELSIQANYAAETGVNDAIYAVQKGGAANITSTDSSSCTGFASDDTFKSYLNPTISSSPKVSYPCLTVTSNQTQLLDTVSDNQASIIPINITDGSSYLTFSWLEGPTGAPTQDNGDVAADQCSQTLQFTTLENWSCAYPVLRMDLFDSDIYPGGLNHTYNASSPDPDTNSRNTNSQLEGATLSFLLYPVYGNSGNAGNLYSTANPYIITYPSTQQDPVVVPVDCDDVSCTVELKMNQSPLSANKEFYDGYARISSIYGDVSGNGVTIGGDSSENVSFQDDQLEIDSTGIDQDEAQRISVRVGYNTPVTPATAPSYAVDTSNSLCKEYSVSPTPSDPDPEDNPPALCGHSLKPAIYLYPTHTEHVNVKVNWPTGLEKTIPTYDPNDGWNVIAQPDGSITNIADGKVYPYLYWEGNKDRLNFDMSQGFVIPGKDTAAFLKQELPIIGLNNNEINGFLQYWVPKMENNKYSLIHFAGSEYTNMAPLTITPKPDSVLRVFMAEEPINSPVKVTPQHFTTFVRTGFTVVEWGGSVLQQVN